MRKQTKLLVGILAVVVVAAVAMYATNADRFQGRLVLSKNVKQVRQISTCGDTWGLVFAGNLTPESVDNNLNIDTPNSHANIASMIESGCDFKVVRMEAAGGGSSSVNFECEKTGVYGGDGIFMCNTGEHSSTGMPADQYYEGMKLSFSDGNVYLVPLENSYNPAPYTWVKIYAKK